METYTYEDIGEVSAVKNSGLQLAMHTGGRVVVTTNKAGKYWSLEGVEITSCLNTIKTKIDQIGVLFDNKFYYTFLNKEAFKSFNYLSIEHYL